MYITIMKIKNNQFLFQIKKKNYFLGNIILKYIVYFIIILQLTTKFINILNYSITTYPINSNKKFIF